MRLHAFNANKEYQKLMFKRNNGKYIKYGTIILSVCILVFAIMYFSFSKFSNTNKFNVINAKVGDFSSGDYAIAAYIDGTKSSTFPDKSSGYGVFNISCTNNATAIWDYNEWGINIRNNNISGTKCNVYFGLSTAFDYTGSEQTFTASKSGYYELEIWGAQGGCDSSCQNYGGFSTGIISLNESDKIYINVGGTGLFTSTQSKAIAGGYNGGGNSMGQNASGSSGGGATSIALKSGTLKDLTVNNISSILIVSGGGGGNIKNDANYLRIGGSGGGYIGSGGLSNNSQWDNTPRFKATGGTQTAGGISRINSNGNASYVYGSGFGYGAGIITSIGGTGFSAGGGGLYGGGYDVFATGGGGGSGYIGNS